MAEVSIPVDLFNPGQVFACLGFLEAADLLIGDAEGEFDWSDEADVRFRLRAAGEEKPVEVVLEFLATSDPQRWGPVGYTDPPPKTKQKVVQGVDDDEDGLEESHTDAPAVPDGKGSALELSDTFPAAEGDRMSLPIELAAETGRQSSWAIGLTVRAARASSSMLATAPPTGLLAPCFWGFTTNRRRTRRAVLLRQEAWRNSGKSNGKF